MTLVLQYKLYQSEILSTCIWFFSFFLYFCVGVLRDAVQIFALQSASVLSIMDCLREFYVLWQFLHSVILRLSLIVVVFSSILEFPRYFLVFYYYLNLFVCLFSQTFEVEIIGLKCEWLSLILIKNELNIGYIRDVAHILIHYLKVFGGDVVSKSLVVLEHLACCWSCVPRLPNKWYQSHGSTWRGSESGSCCWIHVSKVFLTV